MQEARRKLFSLFVFTNFQLPIFRYSPIVVVSKKLRYVHVGKQTFRLLDGATLFVFEPSVGYLVLAMQSISTKTFLGKVLTATQERAGRDTKY